MVLNEGYLNTEPSDHAQEIANITGQGCLPRCNRIYHIRKICMCINAPGSIIDNEWCIQPRTWIIYRIIMAVLVLAFQIYLLADHLAIFHGTVGAPKFFIYLTSWSFIMITATMFTKAVICIRFRRYLGYMEEVNTPRPFFFVWVITNISTAAAIGVTLIYWTAVHKYDQPLTIGTIVGHILNSVIVLIDVWMSSLPFRWGHFYQTLAYGLTYTLFSLIYWACGGTSMFGTTAIYPILDWNRPGLTLPVVLIGVPILLCLLQLALSLMSASRMIVAQKYRYGR